MKFAVSKPILFFISFLHYNTKDYLQNNIQGKPHKLRHTLANLAKQAGMSLEAISEALTHSDTGTTQFYVNTPNVVPMAVGEFALNSLKQ